MMGLMNEVQEGFRQINEAENRVTIAKDGEGSDKKQVLRDNIKFITERMQKNRDLIAKLREQLANSSLKGSQLKSTIRQLGLSNWMKRISNYSNFVLNLMPKIFILESS